MMKVFILALDGLSYNLVHRWNMKHLKQKRYGFFPSIINEYHGEPLSPQVWGSFITGKFQQINNWKVYSKPIEWIRWNTPIKKIKGSQSVSKTFGKRILIPLLKLIMRQKKYVGMERLKGTIIFDAIKNSIALNVPMYNLDSECVFSYTKKILEGDFKAFEEHVRNNSEIMIQDTLHRLPEDWDLFMTWIPIADQMGHVFIRNTKKIRNIYTRLNQLAHNIETQLHEDCLLLIVSDHGMKLSEDNISGCHTNDAFYSLNRDIDWKPHAVTDFYNFIKSIILIPRIIKHAI